MDPSAWPPAQIAAAVLVLCGLLLLAALIASYRALRADRTVLDAFELGGRLSLDPSEVRDTRLKRRRIEALRRLGLLRQSPRGMLVPESAAFAASIERRGRRLRWLALLCTLCLLAASMLAAAAML